MRLAPSLRWSLYATTAVLFGSGIVWLAVRYLPVAAPLPRAAAAVSMRVHGGAVMALLALAGGAVALHVPGAWRERKNLVPGIAISFTLIVLTLTGYGLYYLGDDSAREALSLLHWLFGLALAPVLVWHVLAGGSR